MAELGTPSLTIPDFVAKWRASTRTERAASQEHFIDLCRLLGQPTPNEADPTGEFYAFEKGAEKVDGGDGFADVWLRGRFAWEYKGKRKDLKAAYRQLLLYREDLENPPLLVVCDLNRFEIHTSFTDSRKQVFAFTLAELLTGEPTLACPVPPLDVLRAVFANPARLRPEQTSAQVTERAAEEFAKLATSLRGRGADLEQAARFLMRLLFCLFAEDIGLLPKGLFATLVERTRSRPAEFEARLKQLFAAMAGGGAFGVEDIRHFDGGLFGDDAPRARCRSRGCATLSGAVTTDSRSPDTATPTDLASQLEHMAYRWPLRRYQQLAVDAFEQARAQGSSHWYLVLPPGSGKTVLGWELARRLGRRALVLCPNTAVQAQWLGQWEGFQPPLVAAGADPDLDAPFVALTYQALCNLDDEGAALDAWARALWQAELEREQGLSAEAADAELRRQEQANAEHYQDELADFRRAARQQVAKAGERKALLDLLHPNGRALVERLKQGGPWTLVMDECHHLLAMWGYLARALVEELGEQTNLVGLTATPPDDLDPHESELYLDLFAKADFQVPTPAVVKAGDLAPYQELAYLTTPLPHEADYIAAQHERFQQLLLRLTDPDFAGQSLVQWLRARVGERRSRGGAQVSWERFEHDQPDLARAALRFSAQNGLELPEGARLREEHRQPLTADDWVALIEDFCQGYLRHSQAERDQAAWQEIRVALRSLGYVLTRQGVRSYISPVDRVLALSSSKAVATQTILGIEQRALGQRLRALALCDYERAGGELLGALRGVLDQQAGSAALLLGTLLADADSAALEPILVTGQTVAASRATCAALAAWIEAEVPELRGTIEQEPLLPADTRDGQPDWEDVLALRPRHSWWQPRHYVPLITRYFEAGRSRCLVGTRGLLGEGWDARCVNVLVDLTAASTSTAVHQMRGRSLRLDPELPDKVANNWDVVCVAADHPKGVADYRRFVRKHQHYYAPTVEGEIESGVSHVHPRLSPYGPPVGDAFAGINAEQLERAQARPAAITRWAIGQPYQNRETRTARVRFGRTPGLPARRSLRAGTVSGGRLVLELAVVLLLALGAFLIGLAPGDGLLGLAAAAVILVIGLAWIGRTLHHAYDKLGPSDALEDFGAALADGLAAAGLISKQLGATAVRISAQQDGAYRCSLAGASLAESQLFADGLDEVLSPLAFPRYLVPRLVAAPPRSIPAALLVALRLALPGKPGLRVVYHAVPEVLGANRERAEAFAAAWNRHVSPGRLLYYKDPRAQAILELERGADPFQATTQLRTLWE